MLFPLASLTPKKGNASDSKDGRPPSIAQGCGSAQRTLAVSPPVFRWHLDLRAGIQLVTGASAEKLCELHADESRSDRHNVPRFPTGRDSLSGYGWWASCAWGFQSNSLQ